MSSVVSRGAARTAQGRDKGPLRAACEVLAYRTHRRVPLADVRGAGHGRARRARAVRVTSAVEGNGTLLRRPFSIYCGQPPRAVGGHHRDRVRRRRRGHAAGCRRWSSTTSSTWSARSARAFPDAAAAGRLPARRRRLRRGPAAVPRAAAAAGEPARGHDHGRRDAGPAVQRDRGEAARRPRRCSPPRTARSARRAASPTSWTACWTPAQHRRRSTRAGRCRCSAAVCRVAKRHRHRRAGRGRGGDGLRRRRLHDVRRARTSARARSCNVRVVRRRARSSTAGGSAGTAIGPQPTREVALGERGRRRTSVVTAVEAGRRCARSCAATRSTCASTLGPLALANPIVTASGCFGNGREINRFFDIAALGAVVVKSITRRAAPGPADAADGRDAPTGCSTPSGCRTRASRRGWPPSCRGCNRHGVPVDRQHRRQDRRRVPLPRRAPARPARASSPSRRTSRARTSRTATSSSPAARTSTREAISQVDPRRHRAGLRQAHTRRHRHRRDRRDRGRRRRHRRQHDQHAAGHGDRRRDAPAASSPR